MVEKTRELTSEEVTSLNDMIVGYLEDYRRIDPSNAGVSLDCVGFIFYEGFEAEFRQELLEEAVPLLVMKQLVATDSFELIMAYSNGRWEYGVVHCLLSEPVTVSNLRSGRWIMNWDYDETPCKEELVLDSYDEIQRLLTKKRVFGHE